MNKKICAKCGREVDDSNVFCPYCGNRFEAESTEEMSAEEKPAEDNPAGEKPAEEKSDAESRKPDKAAVCKKAIPAAAVLILCLCVFAIIRSMPVTLKLSDYTTLTVEGYDGIASAKVDFDSDAFNRDVKEAMHKKGTDRLLEAAGDEDSVLDNDILEDLLFASYADSFLSWDLNKSSGISNGDEIELTFRYDKELLEKFRIQMEGDTISMTADGLPEVGVMDPFEGLEVTFSGIEPNGKVTVTNGDDRMVYRTDRNNEVSNGDTVTVTADYRTCSEEQFAEMYGEIASPLEKTYTVEGLDSYLSSFDQLTEAFLETLDKQSRDVIAQSISDNRTIEQSQYKGADRTGMYLLTKKKGTYTWKENRLVLVYTVHCKIGEKTYDYFYPVEYRNILVLHDGKISTNVMNYDKPEGGQFFGIYGDVIKLTEEIYAVGFDTIDQIFNKYVASHVEEYNYQEQFPGEKEE